MIVSICKACGFEFKHLKSKKRKFCSRSCANKNRNQQKVSECLNCGKSFNHYKGDDKKYCSKQCFYLMPRAKVGLSICAFCKKEFSHPIHSERVFCSRQCFYNSKKERIIRECATCGKEFERRPSNDARNKTNLYYCSKKCAGQRLVGKRGPNFKGGYESKGYIYIYQPEHPNSEKSGHMLEHRLIMEQKIGRCLQKDEHVHHINGVKNDNRIENLTIVKTSPHYGKIQCPHCQKHFVIR